MLLERDTETARLTRFLAGEAHGRGRVGVVAGAVGSGKTALLHRVAEHVTSRGARLLSAVGAPDEQAFPYAVVEQLIHGLPPAPSGHPAAAAQGSPPQPVAARTEAARHHALHPAFRQRLARAASAGPVLIVIDDVQFADPESLACLTHTWELMPAETFSLLVALGSPEAAMPAALAELPHRAEVCDVRLGPLTVTGVEGLLAGTYGTAHAARFAPAWHAATGGSPLLVHALLDDTSGRPRTSGASAVRDGAAPETGEMFRQATLACVHRHGAAGLRVARAVAVLGGAERVRLLCALTSLEETAVRGCLVSLTRAGILDGTGFRHEAARRAVLQNVPAEQAGRFRSDAARWLHENGAPALETARQLIAHESAVPHEAWAVAVLREATRQALDEDDTALATQCLQAAERCSTDEQERLTIQADLAQLIWRLKPSASGPWMQSLTEPARAGLLAPAQTLRLAVGLLWNGRTDDAAALIRQVDEAMSGRPDPVLDTQVRTVQMMLATTYPDALGAIRELLQRLDGAQRSPADTAGSDSLRSFRLLRAALYQEWDESATAEADRLLEANQPTEQGFDQVRVALLALVYADRLEQARRWCQRFLAGTEGRSFPGWQTALNAMRGQISLRQGRLSEAAEFVERALEQLPAHAWGVAVGMPLGTLVEARTAMGHHNRAAELLETPMASTMFATRYGVHYLYARGRHQLATGRHDAALADFLACGERMTAWRMDTASLAPWRLGAAETWLALGDHTKAAALAKEQLNRPGQPAARGPALRILAATRPPWERIGLLGRALTALRESGDRYESARALADLGQAHRRVGNTAQGRQLARKARESADSCGAEELSRSLQPEPGRGAAPETGRDGADAVRPDAAALASLTDAERRVAALAVYGHTNREIAAKLFITVSTVEQHLTRVYRKMNISHRQDLPVSLDSDVAHSA
ncbi:AAA family ATPase [Streptomyces sp. NPDC007856]|uniref:helix-turn-helix transcriptional regulator n=1 Tax=Streptomyces sp. NPDC007856 TaxID=3364781 RepID=UPI0036B312D5